MNDEKLEARKEEVFKKVSSVVSLVDWMVELGLIQTLIGTRIHQGDRGHAAALVHVGVHVRV